MVSRSIRSSDLSSRSSWYFFCASSRWFASIAAVVNFTRLPARAAHSPIAMARCVLPGAAVAQQARGLVAVNPVGPAQFQHLRLVHGRREGEVEVGQFLHDREAGELDAVGDGVAGAG